MALLCSQTSSAPPTRVWVGDGFSELQVRLDGAVGEFIAYTAHTNRPEVSARADHTAQDFAEVVSYLVSI
jgi:hypothetical protein